ncbi:hypothetical protein C8Q78DRAFT_736572 [Trametes maxima]|nr:hypothetical protein C8Q78DRAFT_736572 [Trametes maxima]
MNRQRVGGRGGVWSVSRGQERRRRPAQNEGRPAAKDKKTKKRKGGREWRWWGQGEGRYVIVGGAHARAERGRIWTGVWVHTTAGFMLPCHFPHAGRGRPTQNSSRTLRRAFILRLCSHHPPGRGGTHPPQQWPAPAQRMGSASSVYLAPPWQPLSGPRPRSAAHGSPAAGTGATIIPSHRHQHGPRRAACQPLAAGVGQNGLMPPACDLRPNVRTKEQKIITMDSDRIGPREETAGTRWADRRDPGFYCDAYDNIPASTPRNRTTTVAPSSSSSSTPCCACTLAPAQPRRPCIIHL